MSTSLKLWAFCSCQRHHIKHNRTNLHTTITIPHPTCPPQLTYTSIDHPVLNLWVKNHVVLDCMVVLNLNYLLVVSSIQLTDSLRKQGIVLLSKMKGFFFSFFVGLVTGAPINHHWLHNNACSKNKDNCVE
jgi:hypothetical protein